MEYFKYCTVQLKRFSIMNLLYPLIFGIASVFVIGIPIGVVAGILDTVIFKSGTIVNVAFAIILALWLAVVLMCVLSFVKAIDDISKTVDAICIDDNYALYNIWLVLLFNFLTLGIYKFIYFYRLASRLKEASIKYEEELIISPANNLLFTVLGSIVGAGFIIGCSMLIEDLNELAEISNEENQFQTVSYENWGLKNIMSIFDKNKKVNYKQS